jgi:hypothetical protein
MTSEYSNPQAASGEVVKRLRFIGEQLCTLVTQSQGTSNDWKLYDIEWIDVNGAILTEFTELWAIDFAGVKTLLATLAEDGTPYTLTGTKTLKKNIGTTAPTKQGQITLNGSTWSPTSNIESYSYAVIKVNNILTPPTFTDSNNITNDLYEGESATYSTIIGTTYFDVTNVEISANAGDIIKIYYTAI